MSFGPARAAIKARMAAGFTAAPVVYANREMQAPVAPDGVLAPWVFFEVVGGENRVRGVGTPGQRLFIHRGRIQAHVFVPAISDEVVADALADEIAALFLYADFYAPTDPQRVRCQAPETGMCGHDGQWYRVTLGVPFDFYFFA